MPSIVSKQEYFTAALDVLAKSGFKALNIGRKIALEPKALPIKPEPETWQQLVTNKSRILRKTKLRGRKWGEAFCSQECPALLLLT